MGLFDSYDDTAFDEKDKVRLFETHSGRDGSANHYAKAFLAVTLFVVLAAAAVIYLLMPGVGDEIQGSQAMRRSVYDYMLSAEKRTATELNIFKCGDYFWVKVLAEPKPFPPSLLLDDVNQYRLKVVQTEKENFRIETLPLPAKTEDIPCGP